MQLWALIADSFRESRDRKIFWVMVVISLLIAAGMFCFGFEPGKVVVLFGVWEHQTDLFTSQGEVQREFIAGVVVHLIMDLGLGWLGISLAIIATAGFFPALMERGASEVLMSKPLARWQLFLGKYLGSMVFILVQAGLFVVLTFLVMGFRWNAWLPGYLWTIPLAVILFSYVYCVSVLAAVRFRSTVAAVVLSLGAWTVFWGVQTTADLFETYPSWKQQSDVYEAARTLRWIIPKTQDITLLAARWSGAGPSGNIIPEPQPGDPDAELVTRASQVEADRMAALDPVYSIGSSLLFEAVVVLLALWKFSRSDF